MQLSFSRHLTAFLVCLFCVITIHAQKDLPQDYLSKEFHKGRRDAARALSTGQKFFQ
jgi:Xaa-Pro aminopeptidase